MDVEVNQSRNRFDLKFSDSSIFFEVIGYDLATLPTVDFAVWTMLPIAMRRGENLHIKGPVDPTVIGNANELARIWSMWLPEIFSPVEVSADTLLTPAPVETTDSLLLYSGGVDSTYALLRAAEEQGLKHVVTVHGMDYKYNDDNTIANLITKTDPLLRQQGIHRIVVRTNAGEKVRDLGLTHAFVLSSALFLFNRQFATGLLAADITPEQEMMIHPWGTNHVSNAYFTGSSFRMLTHSGDVTRTEKVGRLLSNETALHAASFCATKAVRPHNCGKCQKCARTKAMMIAQTGECSDIFLSPGMTERDVRQLGGLSNNSFRYEIFHTARRNGFLDRLPGFEDLIRREISARRRRRRLEKIASQARTFVSKYLS